MQVENVLRKNLRLKNIHAGKRCFLIGNGPSIKTQDLSVLKDEVTIVVNSFFNHTDAKIINPPYWVIADPLYWEQGDIWFAPTLKDAYKMETATKLFAPLGGYNLIDNVYLGPLIDIHYFNYGRPAINNKIDFSQNIPPYGQNVMLVALMLAFHLGCNPIYFIGCDCDFFEFTEETYNTDYLHHFYTDSAAEKNIMENKLMPWHEWKRCNDVTKSQYKLLHEYASLNGYQVFNATNGGYLETFPRVIYEKLFNWRTSEFSSDEPKDTFRIVQSAVKLIESSDHYSAIILLEEAIRSNVNRPPRVEGIEYLMALCLINLGKPDEALLWARKDSFCNLSNQGNSLQLIQRLESHLNQTTHPVEYHTSL